MKSPTFIVMFFLLNIIIAQQNDEVSQSGLSDKIMDSFNAVGGDVEGVGGSMSYSIGQLLYLPEENVNGITTSGVQVANEIDAIENYQEIDISAYPNPIADYFFLRVSELKKGKLWYGFFDLQGKLLSNKMITETTTKIIPEFLKTGVYFLNVHEGTTILKTLKIVKN